MHRRSLLKSAAALATLAVSRARAAEPKKIALWHIYARDFDMIHLGIKLFNEANNGYVIEPRLIPYVQINPELIRAIATDSPPDLVVINDPDIAGYSSQGQFLDLTDRVAKSARINASSFYKGPSTSDHWRGRRYAVAREMNALSLYINDDLFRAKGLDPEKPPATWAQVLAAAEKLTDPARRVFGFGFCAHQSEQSTFQFLPWLWQAGGGIDRLDQPEATAALQFWTDLVRNGFVSRDVINQQQSEVINTFLAGNTAFAVGGPWELPRFATEAKFQWRVAPLPVKDDKKIEASSLGGFHFAIPKGAKEVDGAFMVIEQMLDASIFPQGWNTGGILAPRSDIEIPSPNWPQAYKVFRTQMITATQRGPHPQWASLSKPLQQAIQEALTGSMKPAQALAAAAAKIKPVLAKTPL
ncbi:MAG: extracellular solute-binding protein [Proteobacteria bacterium]|nr:extracellular solute-binding protein [Pseudomonadota bacterium]